MRTPSGSSPPASGLASLFPCINLPAWSLSSARATPRAAAAYLASELTRQADGSIQVSAPDDPFVMFGAVLRAG